LYISQWNGVGISSIANTKTRIRVKTVGGARSTSPSLFLLVVVAFTSDVLLGEEEVVEVALELLGEEEDGEVTLELLAEEAADVVALTLAGIVEAPETGSVVLPPTTRPAVPSESTVPLIVTGGPPMDRVFPSITIVREPPEA